MIKSDEFYKLINDQNGVRFDFLIWIISLITVIFFSFLTRYVYVRKSRGIANKDYFSSLFFLFSISIFLIISTIKSSLVLSLGMVGALSIVRFRNAIKDTEQVMYLLLLIAFSLSLAANQYLIGVITGSIGLMVIFFLGVQAKETKTDSAFIYLNLNKSIDLNTIIEKLISKDNKIISIEHEGNVFNIVSTLNNYKQAEIVTLTYWFKEQDIEFRITSNQIDC
jgi:hypothetical protein